MVEKLVIRELATLGIGILMTIMTAIVACIVLGITDYDAVFIIGQYIGTICGIILKTTMILVLIVTVVSDIETQKKHRRKRRNKK